MATKHKRSLLQIGFTVVLAVLVVVTYLLWVHLQGAVSVTIAEQKLSLPIPKLAHQLEKDVKLQVPEDTNLVSPLQKHLQTEKQELIAKRRQEQINAVKDFFAQYDDGAVLQGQVTTIVDNAERCGGDYRLLVGIAGSESGLGRIMYKDYNPFGYINGVQYSNLDEAMEFLTCQISRQHLAVCGSNLDCLAQRYGGPETDLAHFKSKVLWFARQVDVN